MACFNWALSKLLVLVTTDKSLCFSLNYIISMWHVVRVIPRCDFSLHHSLIRWGFSLPRSRSVSGHETLLWLWGGAFRDETQNGFEGVYWRFCIDGYSRRIIFLHCSTNNLASTVLSLFESAVERDGGLWPSRIRVDYGVENISVCNAMVAVRGERRGSFIAGSSTLNQRIERRKGEMISDAFFTCFITRFMQWTKLDFWM